MTAVIVIPARFSSTRLPEKMLLSETGWPLVRHTYEQAKKSRKAARVLIATDDDRILSAVKSFGGDVVMTRTDHPSGTDRLAEVAEKHLPDANVIINVQGDEPELEPEKIDRLITLYQTAKAEVGTLVTPFVAREGNGAPTDPNAVKAVLGAPVTGADGDVLGYQALYFSRSLVPYPRDLGGKVENPSDYFLHLGIYAYRPDFLRRYVALPQGRLEKTEKLEQLRVLENGYRIVAGVVDSATPGVDTPDDYTAFVKRWKEKQ